MYKRYNNTAERITGRSTPYPDHHHSIVGIQDELMMPLTHRSLTMTTASVLWPDWRRIHCCCNVSSCSARLVLALSSPRKLLLKVECEVYVGEAHMAPHSLSLTATYVVRYRVSCSNIWAFIARYMISCPYNMKTQYETLLAKKIMIPLQHGGSYCKPLPQHGIYYTA